MKKLLLALIFIIVLTGCTQETKEDYVKLDEMQLLLDEMEEDFEALESRIVEIEDTHQLILDDLEEWLNEEIGVEAFDEIILEIIEEYELIQEVYESVDDYFFMVFVNALEEAKEQASE